MKPYHHGDLREALLAAGDQVLAEHGFKGFTARECARRAGVSHAAPKHHFGSAGGFLTQIAARGFKRLTCTLRESLAGANNLDEEFAATTTAYLAFAEANPEHFRIMFRCDLVDEMDETLHKAAEETYTELTNVILRQRNEPEVTPGTLSGRLPLDTLIEDILIGWAHIHGIAHLRLEHQLNMIPPQSWQAILSSTSARVARLMRR